MININKGGENMNKFEKSLSRMRKQIKPDDDWSQEDKEHYLTIIQALEMAVRNGEK